MVIFIKNQDKPLGNAFCVVGATASLVVVILSRFISRYVDDVIPQRRYTLSILLVFVNTLVGGNTVEHPYYQAIGHTHSSPRQAWRWLNSMWANTSRFRLWPVCSSFTESIMQSRSRRLTLLLNTLHPYLTRLPQPQRIQHDMQCRFC